MSQFHPDLQRAARFIPRFSVSPWLARLARRISCIRGVPKPPVVEGISIEDVTIPEGEGASAIRIRLYCPQNVTGAVPAMLWIHGGGFMFGTPEQDEQNNIATSRELGIVVAAVDYRLAPDHPFPAPLEDCYAALVWLHMQADELGILPDSIAVAGASAGGGLAAGLVLMAHDRKQVPVAFQLLIYPMLDDRTTARTDIETSNLRLWSTKSNMLGWGSYLNSKPGSEGISPYAAPARREDLSGLPPAWIGVGTVDLFHDEDIVYARRLNEAGVHCEVKIVEGAYHGFDVITPKANVVRQFRQTYLIALKRALFPGGD